MNGKYVPLSKCASVIVGAGISCKWLPLKFPKAFCVERDRCVFVWDSNGAITELFYNNQLWYNYYTFHVSLEVCRYCIEYLEYKFLWIESATDGKAGSLSEIFLIYSNVSFYINLSVNFVCIYWRFSFKTNKKYIPEVIV